MATSRPVKTPRTLAIDIGGTGLKASVLDHTGAMMADRVRIETEYPCPPDDMVSRLVTLTKPLPAYDRISVGFPGVVRGGLILSAPHFVTKAGPGTKVVPALVKAWNRYDLSGALLTDLHKPVRTINDADMQGLDVIKGDGLELVVTLGTGVGTAVFVNGRLGPRIELSHHEFHDGEDYNTYLGDHALKTVGKKKWNRRVQRLIATLDALFFPDHMFIGGGNNRHITGTLDSHITIIDPNAGILGGLKLWDLAEYS
ncbi:MAG TPA: ROK family protein [Ilumatobacteraceae bacterium]